MLRLTSIGNHCNVSQSVDSTYSEGATTTKSLEMARRKQVARTNKKTEEKTQRKVRIQNDITEIKNNLIANEEVKLQLSNAAKQLQEIKEGSKSVETEQRRIRRLIVREMGLQKFHDCMNRKEVTATLGDFNSACQVFEGLQKFFGELKDTFGEGNLHDLLGVKYYDELKKCEIQNELMQLLKLGKTKNNIEKNLEEGARLKSKIPLMQKNFARLQQLYQDTILTKKNGKQNDGNQCMQTFEDYLDEKLQELRDEINRLGSYIRTLNSEHYDIAQIVEAKSQELTNLKTQLKSINESDIKTSKEYKSIEKRNELLKIELDNFYTTSEEIARETTAVLNLHQANNDIIKEQTQECKTLEENMATMRQCYSSQTRLKEESEYIAEVSKESAEASLEHLYRVREISDSLTKEYLQTEIRYNELINQRDDVKSANQSMMRVLMNNSSETLHKYTHN